MAGGHRGAEGPGGVQGSPRQGAPHEDGSAKGQPDAEAGDLRGSLVHHRGPEHEDQQEGQDRLDEGPVAELDGGMQIRRAQGPGLPDVLVEQDAKEEAPHGSPKQLGGHVRQAGPAVHPPRDHEAEGDGGVEMAPGEGQGCRDGHGKGQAGRNGNPQQAHPAAGEGVQADRPGADEDQEESAHGFRDTGFHGILHETSLEGPKPPGPRSPGKGAEIREAGSQRAVRSR